MTKKSDSYFLRVNGQPASTFAKKWDFYFLRVNGRLASTFLNLEIRESAPIRSHPTMAFFSVLMRRPREDGLSSHDEFDELNALEDRVKAKIIQDGTAIYVGRSTYGGVRYFYFYVTDPAKFEDAVRVAMQEFPAYEYQTGSREEPNWSTYFEFLYPSETDLERIGNRHVLERLEEKGDNANNERQIDHLALFPSLEAQKAFSAYAQAEGFTIDDAPDQPDDNSQFGVEFFRVDQAARIDDIVVPLFRKIRELGGEYDGWGCEVTP